MKDRQHVPISLDHKLKKLSAAGRKKVEARTAELIAEQLSLRDRRRAPADRPRKPPGS